MAEDYKAFIEEFLSERDKCVMAGKAKFDQEAALKSIIGAGREMGEEVTEQSMTKSKSKDRVQRPYFLDRDIALEKEESLTETIVVKEI